MLSRSRHALSRSEAIASGTHRKSILCNAILVLLAAIGCKEGRSPSQVTIMHVQADCDSARATVQPGVGVGALRLGVTAEDAKRIRRVIRDTVDLSSEGIPRRVLDVVVGRRPVRAYVDSGIVTDIESDDPAVVTSDSLGSGTMLQRLIRLGDVSAVEAEDELFVTSASRCGVSFLLNFGVPDSSHHPVWTQQQLEKLSPAIVTKSVNVYRCTGS